MKNNKHIFLLSEYQDKTDGTLPIYFLSKERVLQLVARDDIMVSLVRLIERVTASQKLLSIPEQLLQNKNIL